VSLRGARGQLAQVRVMAETVLHFCAALTPAIAPRRRGTVLIVPASEAKGISQGSKVSKHGLRASHTAEVFLEDCRIPVGMHIKEGACGPLPQ
jgi:alkylation response protein AidB-like acyl-CoA dehydrogenase